MAKEQDTSPFKGVSCTKMGLSSLSGTPCASALPCEPLVQGKSCWIHMEPSGGFPPGWEDPMWGWEAREQPGMGARARLL